MQPNTKRLRIMAGPNGSGKSTIIEQIRNNYYCGPFVNADKIEKSFAEKKLLNLLDFGLQVEENVFDGFLETAGKSWTEKARNENALIRLRFSNNNLVTPAGASKYDAAIAADFVRHQLLLKNETFTFETVLSHPSKISLLKEAQERGYKNYVYFICTVSPQINVARVHQRVLLGGHDVPEDKILKRYKESLDLLPQLIPLTYRTFLFDNSVELGKEENRTINLVAEIEQGEKLIIHNQNVPLWIEEKVINPIFRK